MAKKDPREERISKICAEINKSDYGGEDHNAVTWLGSRDAIQMERWPTGCSELDEALGGGWPKGRQIEVFGPESGGKCHAKGTPILLFDGHLKMVEDIVVGDLVMGPDSTPREVLHLARGREPMYRISPRRGIDNSFVVNKNHILSLKNTEIGPKFGEIVDIPLGEYLKRSKNFQYYHKLYQVAVEWSEKRQAIEPYFLGLWLGDGSSDSVRVHTEDDEVVEALESYADRIGHSVSVVDVERCPGYSIVSGKGRYQSEFCLQNELRNIGVLGNKHIPHLYKTGNREQRMELLAGLIDSDGYRGASKMVFSNVNKTLAEDVIFVARSLGFFCNMKEYMAELGDYSCIAYKVYINGNCTQIPLRVARKVPTERVSNRDPLVVSFDVDSAGDDDFYGFILDEDHRYLMGNFIVQHNTTLCLHAIAEHQHKYIEEECALVDAEYAFDETYAKAIGVDTKYLIVCQPDSGEQALSVTTMLIERGVGLIIVDSVAALVPQAELEDDSMGGGGLGVQARMMSQGLRRINTEAGKRLATLIWTNQMREKIGVMFGDPKTTPAGRALKHYASIRVDIKSIGKIKETVDGNSVVVSNKTRAIAKKNKTAPPFRQAEFSITFGIGIDRVAGAFDRGVALKVITKRGSWLSFEGENLAQGRMNVINMLRVDNEMFVRIEDANKKAVNDGVKPATEAVSAKPVVGKGARTPVVKDEDSLVPGSEVEVTDV